MKPDCDLNVQLSNETLNKVLVVGKLVAVCKEQIIMKLIIPLVKYYLYSELMSIN